LVQTVLTGNLRLAAEIKLGTLGLDENLDMRIGGFGSDDRDRFQLPAVVAERYEQFYCRQLDPQRTVVIGDAPNDIACARYAGFRVIVVAHRVRRAELEVHHPDAVVDRLDPNELAATIHSVLAGTGTHPAI
jgi:phosphoglycolate phosphatase-like HAD superfamily hydrolase